MSSRGSRQLSNQMTGFECNICGAVAQVFPEVVDGREHPTCTTCGSSVRMRSVIYFLCKALLGGGLPLEKISPNPRVVGLGLSDWEGYARLLSEKFSYTNTYYHQEPFLDIVNPPATRLRSCDFLISSDVFEHVPPPVSRAFAGSFALLKPGGLLVLTVPFTGVPEIVEHFPHLSKYRIIKFDEENVLVNRRDDGAYEVYTNLVFHGGPGETLEMRVFNREGTVDLLKYSGFVDIHVHDEVVPEWGIRPPHSWGLPITARKPAT